jgi:hypothetical protein
MHANFLIPSFGILSYLVYDYLQKNIIYKNINYLLYGIILIILSLTPIIYDQIYLTNNITAILKYAASINDISFFDKIRKHSINVTQFLPTFFIDFIYTKEYKVFLLEKGITQLGSHLSVYFWIFYLLIGYIILYIKKIDLSFTKNVIIIITISIIVCFYISMGKVGESRVYKIQYPVRYMYACGCLFILCMVNLIDQYYNQINTYIKNKHILLLAFIMTISLIFNDAKNIFNKKVGHNSGYFMIPTYISTDFRIEEIFERIEQNFTSKEIDIFVETDNWPILSGITSVLLRNNYQVKLHNQKYEYFFKMPDFSNSNLNRNNIYITNKISEYRKLIYNDKELYIYTDKLDSKFYSLKETDVSIPNLIQGWSKPENDFTWAIGPETEFQLDKINNKKDLNIEFLFKTPYGLKRDVVIYMNNNKLGKFNLFAEDYKLLQLKIPSEYLKLENNIIKFKFENLIEMNKIGYTDSRKLGLAINYIYIH